MTSHRVAAADLGALLSLDGAWAVSQPQRRYLSPGGQLRLGLAVGLSPSLDVRVAGVFTLLPATVFAPVDGFTGAEVLEVGARWRLPGRVLAPFLEVGGGVGRSGLTVLSATARAGLTWRVSDACSVNLEAGFTEGFPLGSVAEGTTVSRLSLVSAGLTVELRLIAGPVAPRETAQAHETTKETAEVAGPAQPSPAPLPTPALAPAPAPAPAEPPPAPVTAPAAPTRAPAVKVTATKVELRERIPFKPGKATLEAGAAPILSGVARALNEHAEVCVRVDGHTDAAGDALANLELSIGRADAVREALVAQKVDGRRLTSRGFGASVPVASNVSPAGREKNRRVELLVVPCPTRRAAR